MRIYISLVIAAAILFSCQLNMGQNYKHTNKLIDETSPYLLQHAHNPVNWQAWGNDALEEAEKEDKLIIISIGYAACHWCHVMEQESFEDELVAQKMNDNYISIKVDREERPDIDQVYMTAAQLMTGRGGWPLNIIALPNGKPIYAGTYFPKESWEKVLDYHIDKYKNDRQAIIDLADRVTEGIKQAEIPDLRTDELVFDSLVMNMINDSLLSNIDFANGGRNGTPKFPMPSVYELMLTSEYFNSNSEMQKALKLTLDKMADGGIFDHLGGGFARYSTDDKWIVPHFEKMLYDNSQLISLYSHAYQMYGDEKYAQTVRETITFCERELSDKNGGFYSSLDADSEGEEGKFYVWYENEVDSLLGTNSSIFRTFYGISKRGNFEGKNILVRHATLKEMSKKFNLSVQEIKQTIESGKSTLLKHRSSRIRPALDDKILTAWNGLMITGLVDAYFALDEQQYLNSALKTGDFLIENQIDEDGKILRNHKNGQATITGFLDDYAFTILAFIKLYEATFDEKWLYQANTIKDYAIKHFSDKPTGMFFYTADNDAQLIARKMELSDNVIPSSNSAMAHALFQLGQYFYHTEDIDRAAKMLGNSEENFKVYPHYYNNWARLYFLMGNTHYEIAIVGSDAQFKKMQVAREFVPNKILLGGKDEGTLELLTGKLSSDNTLIYVCQNKSCQLPTSDVNKALNQLKRTNN